ncbi:MAG: vitamin K epoxide reductase family protein [Cyclobacteriaceae bacterium]
MQSSDSKLVDVAEQYLTMIKAKISTTSIKRSLLENSYYPSLYSLNAVCNRFGVPNEAFKMPAENLDQLDGPFLAFYNDSENDFVVVTKITADSVHLVMDRNKKIIITKEQFLRNYRDVIFVAEPNENSGEKDYLLKIEDEKRVERKKLSTVIISVVVAILLFATSFYTLGTGATNFAFLALIKLLGVGATILLLTYEVDKSNQIVKSICSAGKHNGCDAVLNSGASKIFGMSWSELGFYYFASTILFLLYPGVSPSIKITCLIFATALASPYIIFSLYYQWIRIKQWCPLCLTVQAALFLELAWSIYNFLSTDQLLSNDWASPLTIILAVICVSLPIIGWSQLKPIISSSKKAPEYEAAFKRLLYNPDTFDALLQQQETAAEGWQALGITIGNPNAPNTILKVCNPYCGPCAKAHPPLEEIILHNKNYNLRIIFTASNEDNDPRATVVKHLLAVAEKGNPDQTAKAIDDWYNAEQKNYENFATKYPMNGELKQQGEKIEDMAKWCKESMISFTPTIFINGKRLPENYSAQELKFILQ